VWFNLISKDRQIRPLFHLHFAPKDFDICDMHDASIARGLAIK